MPVLARCSGNLIVAVGIAELFGGPFHACERCRVCVSCPPADDEGVLGREGEERDGAEQRDAEDLLASDRLDQSSVVSGASRVIRTGEALRRGLPR